MKEVTIDGVRYLPANALAKQFRYTTDYIGQLCRAKKVDAQLVGRSWYVNPLSLEAHKKNKHKKTPDVSVEKNTDSEYKIKISSLDVVRPKQEFEANTRPDISEVPKRESNYIKRLNWQPLKYEEDAEELLPKILPKQPQTGKIRIELAGATDLAIKTSTKPTLMVAEEMPEVSLKGKLKVSSLDNSFETEDVEPESDRLQDFPEEIAPEVIKPSKVSHNRVSRSFSRNSLSKHSRRPISLIPTQKSKEADARVLVEANIEITNSPFRFVFFSVTTVFVGLVALLLFSEATLKADSISYEHELNFSKPSSAALVSLFSY